MTPGSPLRLVLASASPRRQELLREAGFEFDVCPADIDEEAYPAGLLPADIAAQLAMEKARVVAQGMPDRLVLGADTVVAFGDLPLGKPADAYAARHMLALLAGTTHIVITGIALVRVNPPFERAARVMSAVRMRGLGHREIEAYVGGGEWRGKAGGYGIQDKDPFVKQMSGSHSNIVGLPMEATRTLLASAGILPTGHTA